MSSKGGAPSSILRVALSSSSRVQMSTARPESIFVRGFQLLAHHSVNPAYAIAAEVSYAEIILKAVRESLKKQASAAGDATHVVTVMNTRPK